MWSDSLLGSIKEVITCFFGQLVLLVIHTHTHLDVLNQYIHMCVNNLYVIIVVSVVLYISNGFADIPSYKV